MKTWVPWLELTGQPRGTKEDLWRLIDRCDRSSLLVACAQLGVAFGYGPDAGTTAEDDALRRWLPHLFPSPLRERVQRYADAGRIIFFQAQLRFLANEVVRRPPADVEQRPLENCELGELLLRSGELLYKPHLILSDQFDRMANLVAEFLPVAEVDSLNDPVFNYLRMYIFITVIVPRMDEKYVTFDIPALFVSEFGFSLKMYYQALLAFGNHALQGRESKPSIVEDAGIRVDWFRHSDISPELVERIFKTVSFEPESLNLTSESRGYADFDLLRDFPYVLHNKGIYCLDYEFAFGKLESAVLWRILRRFDKKEGDRYLSFWGNVFQEYVIWLLETYVPRKLGRIEGSPRYTDDSSQEICDVIVICGQTAVLIEAKLATCPSSIKYSVDYVRMRKYLEERLVVGSDRRVGVTQLVDALEKISGSKSGCLPDFLKGIKKFIPLIITRDDIGSSWMTNAYLNARFKQEFQRKEHRDFTVAPLVSMSIATLERAVHALKRISLVELLEDRIRKDKPLSQPFEAASSHVGRGTPRDVGKHIDIFSELTDELVKDWNLRDA